MVHPFSLDDDLDENLELFFGLSICFLNCKIGTQGVDESFSFVIAADSRDKEIRPFDVLEYPETMPEESCIQILKLSVIQH